MGRNNKSIHLLRGNKNNHPNEKLDSGQPFYDRYSNSLYIGNGNTLLESLTPISGGWDYIDKGNASSAGYHIISFTDILSKIKTAGFLHCSHKGGKVALQGITTDDDSNAREIEDTWHLIYIHNSPNSTDRKGAILAIGDTAGVFYANIDESSASPIKWKRLSDPRALYYRGKDSNPYVFMTDKALAPNPTSQLDLGTVDNIFKTIYANKYSIIGTEFNFQYNSTASQINPLIGYKCYDVNGDTLPINTFVFRDGKGDSGDLTWINAKGLDCYRSNEINIRLPEDQHNVYFGRRDSNSQITGYAFLDGISGNYPAPVHRGATNLKDTADTKKDEKGNIIEWIAKLNPIWSREFTTGNVEMTLENNLKLDAWTYGGTAGINDGAMWACGPTRARFFFKNDSADGNKWHLLSIEAPSFNATSDRRLKENITPFTPEKSILDLPVYTFNFKSDTEKKKHVGCLAQDLQEICPELVNADTQGYLSIEESKITYLLLEEVKELKKQVEELKKKVSNEEKVSNNSNNLDDSSNMLGDR